jgi:hypothetical protein
MLREMCKRYWRATNISPERYIQMLREMSERYLESCKDLYNFQRHPESWKELQHFQRHMEMPRAAQVAKYSLREKKLPRDA